MAQKIPHSSMQNPISTSVVWIGRCLALSVVGLTLAGSSVFAEDVETLSDRNAPGILLEGKDNKDVLPQGMKLRPVYKKGIELTKNSEGWVPKRYNDAAGYCTVGYGHLLKNYKDKNKSNKCDGTGSELEFLSGISLKRGEELLIEDMMKAQVAVQLAAPGNLTDGQYAALVDFAFNVGSGNFKNSTLLQVVKDKQFDRVPAQFRRWTKAGGKVLQGLKNRREAEIRVFFDGQAIPKPAPIPNEDLSQVDVSVGKGERVK